LGLSAATIALGMFGLWLLSIRVNDVSFIDSCWGAGFVVVAVVAYFADPTGDSVRRGLLLVITTVWGLRLATYLLWRWRRNGPDKRYVSMLRHAPGNKHVFTLIRVFGMQGFFMFIVSLPVQLGQVYARPTGLTPQALVGLALCTLGIGFESIADLQLTRFRANSANAGQVMDGGLWRYTRHPNYFGDACTWWGLFLVAVVNPVTAVAVLGPVLMTTLLLRYSGIGPLERGLRRRHPDYEAYAARTSAFLPMPRRKSSASLATAAGGDVR